MLVPEKHPLARKKRIRWNELAGEKFLLLHEVHALSKKVRELLAANKLNPEVVLQGAQLVTIAMHGGGRTGRYGDSEDDGRERVYPGMRGSAFCPPSADA